MTDQNEAGVAVVSHDSESRTLVEGYEGNGTYERHVHYIAPGLTSVAQLVGLPIACLRSLRTVYQVRMPP